MFLHLFKFLKNSIEGSTMFFKLIQNLTLKRICSNFLTNSYFSPALIYKTSEVFFMCVPYSSSFSLGFSFCLCGLCTQRLEFRQNSNEAKKREALCKFHNCLKENKKQYQFSSVLICKEWSKLCPFQCIINLNISSVFFAELLQLCEFPRRNVLIKKNSFSSEGWGLLNSYNSSSNWGIQFNS